jgi:hypothetical protein
MRLVMIAIVVGIAILLPLTVCYGVNLIDAPRDWSKSSNIDYDQKIRDAKTPVEKKKLEQEQSQRQGALEAADRRHERILFFVAYPVGLAAFLIGSLLRLRAASIGLIYGGIVTLVFGCYTYWDKMDRWLRFESLLLTLVLFLVYGYVKFRPDAGALKVVRPAG